MPSDVSLPGVCRIQNLRRAPQRIKGGPKRRLSQERPSSEIIILWICQFNKWSVLRVFKADTLALYHPTHSNFAISESESTGGISTHFLSGLPVKFSEENVTHWQRLLMTLFRLLLVITVIPIITSYDPSTGHMASIHANTALLLAMCAPYPSPDSKASLAVSAVLARPLWIFGTGWCRPADCCMFWVVGSKTPALSSHYRS